MRIRFTLCLLFGAAAAWAQTAQKSTTGPDARPALPEPADAHATDAGTTAREAPKLKMMPFTRENIRKIVGHHQNQIQACYEETLADREKPLEGKLMVTFVITPEGLVKKAAVAKKGTTLHDPKLHDCVLSVVNAMTFPQPADGREHPVEYPFNLKALR